jgi:hypothetical protein
MATIQHHISRLHEKPSHIRERIAFGVSGGVTALVAVGWLVAMSASGAFSLATKSVANSVTPDSNVQTSITDSTSNFKNMLGAASAALGATTTDSAISVVDASTTTDTPAAASGATSIPF